MGNGAQHAIATGVAAHLCKKYGPNPAGVYERHLEELKMIADSITGRDKIQSRL